MFAYYDVVRSGMSLSYMDRQQKLRNRGVRIVLHLDHRSHVTDMWQSKVIQCQTQMWSIHCHIDIKAKQPESGDLCDNITEFGVA